jgi:hypothetical protein
MLYQIHTSGRDFIEQSDIPCAFDIGPLSAMTVERALGGSNAAPAVQRRTYKSCERGVLRTIAVRGAVAGDCATFSQSRTAPRHAQTQPVQPVYWVFSLTSLPGLRLNNGEIFGTGCYQIATNFLVAQRITAKLYWPLQAHRNRPRSIGMARMKEASGSMPPSSNQPNS